MKEINNKPLTEFSKLSINIADRKHLDLTKTNIPNQDELVKKFLQEIAKLKGSESFIIAQSRDDESYIMAKIIPSKKKNNVLIFPEPNPITIYYNTGIEHLIEAQNLRNEIIKIEWNPDDLYLTFIEFFQKAFQAITQLIMSLEGLYNQLIPENFVLNRGEKKMNKTELTWEDFKTKFRYRLPAITGVDLFKDYKVDYQNIIRLNGLRNDLIHLKSIKKENFTFYQDLYKQLIDFDFEKHGVSIHKVISLMLNLSEE